MGKKLAAKFVVFYLVHVHPTKKLRATYLVLPPSSFLATVL